MRNECAALQRGPPVRPARRGCFLRSGCKAFASGAVGSGTNRFDVPVLAGGQGGVRPSKPAQNVSKRDEERASRIRVVSGKAWQQRTQSRTRGNMKA